MKRLFDTPTGPMRRPSERLADADPEVVADVRELEALVEAWTAVAPTVLDAMRRSHRNAMTVRQLGDAGQIPAEAVSAFFDTANELMTNRFVERIARLAKLTAFHHVGGPHVHPDHEPVAEGVGHQPTATNGFVVVSRGARA